MSHKFAENLLIKECKGIWGKVIVYEESLFFDSGV